MASVSGSVSSLCGYSRGFPEEGRQTTVEYSKTLISSPFGRYIFGTLANKAIISSLVVFPLTSKYVTLNDAESPCYVEFRFTHVRLEFFAWISKTIA